MPRSNADSVARLAEMQGPIRHAWWLFWNRKVLACYSIGMPSWVVNFFCLVGRLERLTRYRH